MTTIKKLLFLPTICLLIISMTQCSSAQVDTKAPATVKEAFYQEWVGGRPGSKGTLVTIKLDAPDTKMIFDSLYFDGKAVKLKSNLVKNEQILTGNFMVVTNPNDLVLHVESEKEFGNTAPNVEAKIPFELEINEAIISYSIHNKKRYFRI